MRITTFVISVALTSLTGCASIVNGQNQSVSVETRTESGPVSGANCKLSNNKGTWYVTTPGSTTVNRSYEDLAVRCDKTNVEPGLASVKSATKGMAFGNILFGGIIGAGVDMSTGAAYDYPTLITVMMGTNAVIAPAPAVNGAPPSQATPAAFAPPAQTANVQADAAVAPTALPAGIVALPQPVVAPQPAKAIGVDSYSAERLARQSACNVEPAAALISKGPGYESYSVKCTSGDVQMIRCELGNCRVLK